MRILEIIRQRRNVRRLLAAGLLLIALIDLGSHAVFASSPSNDTRTWTWCDVSHYTSPGVDCPHKRERRAPDKSAFDETSHNAVLIDRENLEVAGICYRSIVPTREHAVAITRPQTPPFHPPKQA